MQLTTPAYRVDQRSYVAVAGVMAHDVLPGKTIEEAAKASRSKWLVIVSAHDHNGVVCSKLASCTVVINVIAQSHRLSFIQDYRHLLLVSNRIKPNVKIFL